MLIPVAGFRHLVDLEDHFLRPRNVGELDDADAIGEAGSFSCGGMLRMTLRIDATQRINDVRFRAIGCSLLIAGVSILTETVKGMTTAEAAALAQSPALAAALLGVFPEARLPCLGLCCDVLVSAIQHFSDAKRQEWNGEDALICTCFGVSEKTIESEIETKNLTTIAEVTSACNAGAGCRSCYSLIEDILQSSKQ
jgi:NifU-like protein